MGKIIEEYTSEYDVGDVVIFKTEDCLLLGIIEGYYIDHSCDNSFGMILELIKQMFIHIPIKEILQSGILLGKLKGF